MLQRILPLLLGLASCAAPAPPAALENPDVLAFRLALDQYRDAVNNAGFDLRKPDAGHGPISHVSLGVAVYFVARWELRKLKSSIERLN